MKNVYFNQGLSFGGDTKPAINREISTENIGEKAFMCYILQTRKKQIIKKLLNEAIKIDSREKRRQNMTDGQIEEFVMKFIEKKAKRSGLAKNVVAFVKNFYKSYWLSFEPEVREEPGSMLDYLFIEKLKNLWKNGYFSFFISMVDSKGEPAGIASRAIIKPNTIFRALKEYGISPDEAKGEYERLTVLFNAYLAVPKESIGENNAEILRKTTKEYVEGLKIFPDYEIVQVEPWKNGLMERYKQDGWKEIGELKSMEIVHDYYKDFETIVAPEKQPPLNLLIRPKNKGQDAVNIEELKTIIEAFYLYYGVEPEMTIKGTGQNAIDAYMKYALANVKPDEKSMVKLI
ncbi:MAG: hypothetical protein ABIH83_03555 [Candidatus Micrarchaeota archaeon]